MSEITQKLQELEIQKQELLEKQKQLEKESRYHILIKERDDFFEKEKKQQQVLNLKINAYFEELVENGVKDYVKLETKIKSVSYPSYRCEDLKPEDIPQPMELEQNHISINYGHQYNETIYKIENNKAESYSIVGSSRAVLAKTLAQKIKEKQESKKAALLERQKKDLALQKLIGFFKEKYNLKDDDFEIKEEYKHDYGTNRHGYYISTLKITFPNTSWLKIKYYSDSSWSIIDKFDHKAPKTKEDWVDYLSK